MTESQGSKEYEAFTEALEKVLSVSHDEIKRREAADKMVREYTGRRRKPKKTSASGGRVSPEKD